ncbi:serine/threonine protein kinase [Streptomyces sp. Ru71]|uniref:serine/threonine protein kinase n=1 Tax=Streptomyces sp. Ru71 TaxID=2080746 RepID=UPI000CDD9089|nr:serine/threonine-protein kinase [Streptomyces sp. Ru71]POX52766.1 serine/threonine protein kinase [Streptomyces sp. Ru71]
MDALKAHDPAHIGAYTLLARLGAGGMGQVYLGRSPGGRLVALKVIRDEITDHPEALARFRREVETVRAVRSAYTANLIDASLDSTPLWLATEYVAGPTLARAVAEHGPVPAGSALRLLAALAEALASVHAYGVTHRDLKPHNVILSPRGPLLIDFGIARGAADTALTRTGLTPGTPGYTAPEVLTREQVGPEADVFALGATVAHAVTGRAPFGGGAGHAVSYRVVHEDIDLAGVEPAPAALIGECVAKDPGRRPGLDEIIARCAVTSALTEDPYYARLAGQGEAAPQDLPAAVAAGLVPPGHGARPVASQPTVGPGYTPTALPAYAPTLALSGPTAVPARPPARRRTAWIVTLAVAVVVGSGTAVAVRTWGGQEQQAHGGGAAPSASPVAQGKPPAYIEDNRISRDYWLLSDDPDEAAHGIGKCTLIGAESPPYDVQTSVRDAVDPESATVRTKVKISFRFKEASWLSEKPAPYYVSVGVKPAHEIDSDTGRPFDTLMESKNIGYTSKPVDAYRAGDDSGFVELTYPDDFHKHVEGRTWNAIPVTNDPGDWTVVLYHVKSSPTDYQSFGCTGFRVGSS